ncbi:MAG TPA: response regulator [Bauldia sp.]|nr:response regulator [Bauldia sp.]
MSAVAGKRVLVVEDEAMVASMVEDMLVQLGALVVGPAASVARALVLCETESVDAAVLDVNVRGEMIDDVAALLAGRGVPLVLATGYGASVADAWPGAQVIDKPYTRAKLDAALTLAFAPRT